MKTKDVMASFAAILIALSTIGFAYSGWTDYVTFEGVAHMGEFIVGIMTDPLPDGWEFPYELVETTNGYPEDGTGAPTSGPGSFEPKPWVANTTIELDDYRTSVHHEPTQTVAHTMRIKVENAYPQYDSHIHFLLKNAGTVPAHIRVILLGATAETDGVSPYPLEMREEGWTYDGTSWNNNGSLYDPVIGEHVILWRLKLDVPLTNDANVQLEPCHHYDAWIDFEFTQEAEECHTYKFSFIIDAIQWNMDYEWDLGG